MLSIHFTYLILVVTLLILTIYYTFTETTGSTLIPCMNSKWYAAFTIFRYVCIIAAFVINALEMRRTACGVYTTSPVSAGLDQRLCDLVDGSL